MMKEKAKKLKVAQKEKDTAKDKGKLDLDGMQRKLTIGTEKFVREMLKRWTRKRRWQS